MSVTLLEIAVAVVVSLGAAIVQGSMGLGFNIISVPILALVDPRLAPVPQLIVSMPLSIAVLLRERSHVDLRAVGWIVAGRFPGAALGLALLVIASRRTLDLLLATFVLLAVAVIARGRQIRRSRSIDFAAGIASGVSGLVASMGGPPLALVFSGERGPTLRSSLAVVFTLGLTLSVATRTIGGKITLEEVWIGVLLTIPAALGFAVSSRLLSRVEGRILRSGVLALSTVAATALLVRALVG